ncbi:hypothetical protein C9374_000352 [Naegleria lovaniensis]|uniref:Homeobox domain-containing protein n=1 Tax=Naegleria lovaniensis TaxID=51637 RepID=A0AA88KP06_NAELO|nr:uncharacterized protein C9374_000352 [Naegleria lovaniensis]KAG2388913.1 hypothetical protein C9374_000352 [Naegleria lovaniensis]
MSTQHHEESSTMPMSTATSAAKCQHVPTTTPFPPPFLINNSNANNNMIKPSTTVLMDSPFSSLYTTNSYSSSLQNQPFNTSYSSFPSQNYYSSSISSMGEPSSRLNPYYDQTIGTLHTATNHFVNNNNNNTNVDSSAQNSSTTPMGQPQQLFPTNTIMYNNNNNNNTSLNPNSKSQQGNAPSLNTAVGGDWSPSVTHLPNMSTPIKTVASLNKNIPMLQTNLKRPSNSIQQQQQPFGNDVSTTDSQSSPPPVTTQTSSNRNLPKDAVAILKSWFFDHQAHPYPTEEEKAMLCEKTGLSHKRINYWFINARRRLLPNLKKEEKKAKSVTSIPKRKRRLDESSRNRSHRHQPSSSFITRSMSDGADEMDVHVQDLGEENNWVVECLLELSKNDY